MQSITFAVDVLWLKRDSEARRCPACEEPLRLHQPDVESPDRLLGVCDGCRGWYLIDFEAGVLLRLPDRQKIANP